MAQAMVNCPAPVVAAVNGPAVGLGCSLALLCDIVVMAETAYLRDTHVLAGLVAGDGGSLLYPMMGSLLRAKELLLLGERIGGADALAFGFANRVVPQEELMTTALNLARRLAAQPREAVQDTKRALNMHLSMVFPSVMGFGLAAESESFLSPAVTEVVANLGQGTRIPSAGDR